MVSIFKAPVDGIVHLIMAVDLVPGHPYPAQLSQAIDAFQTLLNAGFDMENVSSAPSIKSSLLKSM